MINIKNHPLDLSRRVIFQVIGAYFGGLESIAMETLNLINCSKVRIQVQRNLCGFMTTTIELRNVVKCNCFLNFEDFNLLEAHDLYFKEFSNPIDLSRFILFEKDTNLFIR